MSPSCPIFRETRRNDRLSYELQTPSGLLTLCKRRLTLASVHALNVATHTFNGGDKRGREPLRNFDMGDVVGAIHRGRVPILVGVWPNGSQSCLVAAFVSDTQSATGPMGEADENQYLESVLLQLA